MSKSMKIIIHRYGSICEPDIIEGFAELGLEILEITNEVRQKNLLPQRHRRDGSCDKEAV